MDVLVAVHSQLLAVVERVSALEAEVAGIRGEVKALGREVKAGRTETLSSGSGPTAPRGSKAGTRAGTRGSGVARDRERSAETEICDSPRGSVVAAEQS